MLAATNGNRVRMATFFVLAKGHLGSAIAKLAEEHAAFAPECRRVLNGDEWTLRSVPSWGEAAAVVVDADGVVRVSLDPCQGLSGAWIEDAFVRAKREV